MAKVDFNSSISSIRGKVDGFRFSKRGKQGVVSVAPEKPKKKRQISAREEATQERTVEANGYSRRVKESPEQQELWARYKAVAVARGCPPFAVSNKDFNNPPVVEAIDASAYRGEPGQRIRIRAHDDFEVRDVMVVIKSRRATLDNGPATRAADGDWHFAATVPASGAVTIEATARDWPDHQHSKSIHVDLNAPPAVDDSPRGRLVGQIRALAQRRGSYRHRDGRQLVYYFDKYRLAHSPAVLREVAGLMAPLTPPDTELLAGLELGGVPIATMLSQSTGKPLVLLRKAPRDWGTMLPAEGGDLAGRRVLPIADVVTTGNQLGNAIRFLRNAGAIVTHALCILDEQSGAPGLLQKQGVALTSLFTGFELVA